MWQVGHLVNSLTLGELIFFVIRHHKAQQGES